MAENVIDLIKEGEGLSLDMYDCPAGYKTIGYGHNLEANGITQDIAEALLLIDMEEAKKNLASNSIWLISHDPVRQAVIIDMCFNMGWPTLSKFKNFLAAFKEKNYQDAGYEMVDSRWFRQVGNRGEKLVKMMQSGEWQ